MTRKDERSKDNGSGEHDRAEMGLHIPQNLIRRITITEIIRPDGMRQFGETSQSFELESGQALSSEDAQTVALRSLGPSRLFERYQSPFGHPCSGTLTALKGMILEWPKVLDRKTLSRLVCGQISGVRGEEET